MKHELRTKDKAHITYIMCSYIPAEASSMLYFDVGGRRTQQEKEKQNKK